MVTSSAAATVKSFADASWPVSSCATFAMASSRSRRAATAMACSIVGTSCSSFAALDSTVRAAPPNHAPARRFQSVARRRHKSTCPSSRCRAAVDSESACNASEAAPSAAERSSRFWLASSRASTTLARNRAHS
eukprot:CAMPEP_0183342698 /NCGR_PEP_ID=MMETSP0164_2-20130417/8761_1 /TAXON_ID=221442 /ORGANISM="Coccolithus pelagicus ssp braarudi, Strain PLY182g" /LENGTH=133 /DNA_ID=CAMNT_0025513363 /DNA_START=503 /DNA_END=901 /DNA_ORIENTATION=-